MIPFKKQPKFKLGETAYFLKGSGYIVVGKISEASEHIGFIITDKGSGLQYNEDSLLTPSEYMRIKNDLDDLPF
jgi:hypothetical protein